MKVVTVGLSPAWDVTCRCAGLEWGEHKVVDEQTVVPAGKAMNISRALAWMGGRSVAAGFWGREDFGEMVEAMRPLRRYVRVEMTAVRGRTRRNVNVVDTAGGREIHLRNRSELATRGSLRRLRGDLRRIVDAGCVCVFAGSMPGGELLEEAVRTVRFCRELGAKVAVDTSGEALRRLVEEGGLWLVKPNVAELREVVGRRVADEAAALAEAGRGLLEKATHVLISRGENGTIVVSGEAALQARVVRAAGKVGSTVGCGDFLVAGFVEGMRRTGDAAEAVGMGVKVATARACGLWAERAWREIENGIGVEVSKIRRG